MPIPFEKIQRFQPGMAGVDMYISKVGFIRK
jgi:hypothetical protein